MKKICTLLTALLLAVLVLPLTACKDTSEEVRKVDFQPAPAYEAEDIPLPVPTGDLIGCCTDGENMYILADEKVEDEVRSVLCRVPLADGTTTKLEDYQAPETPEGGYVNRFGPVLASDGTLWVYEILYIPQYTGDSDPKTISEDEYYTHRDEFHHLRQLDPNSGREKKLVDISSAIQELEITDFFDESGFMVDSKGNVFVAGTGGVAVVDKSGNLLFSLQANIPHNALTNADGGVLALLPDGDVAVLTSLPGGKREVRVVDAAAKGWGVERYEVPGSVDLIYSGTNGFLFCYISGGVLWGWEPGAEEGWILLDWSTVDLPGSRMCFSP